MIQRFTHEPRAQGQRRVGYAFVGHGPAIRQVQALLHAALRSPEPVIVSGAPGTGKRVVAELLHQFGEPGRELAYVCPLEAHDLDAQAELLAEPGPQRWVIGTHLDPHAPEARARLHPRALDRGFLHIPLPSLRERVEDLEALVLRLVAETPSSRPVWGISDAALDCLRQHPWPGNLDELREVVREALDVGTGEQIEIRDLTPSLRQSGDDGADCDDPELQLSLAVAERAAIERALRYARGNKRKAARLLRIGKTTLYRKLHGYDAEDDVDPGDDG